MQWRPRALFTRGPMTAASSGGGSLPTLEDLVAEVMGAHGDAHAVLGVEKGAGRSLIRVAWRARSRRLHPDHSRDAGTSEAWITVQEAHKTLTDPKSVTQPPRSTRVPQPKGVRPRSVPGHRGRSLRPVHGPRSPLPARGGAVVDAVRPVLVVRHSRWLWPASALLVALTVLTLAAGVSIYWQQFSGDGTLSVRGGPRCITMQWWRWRWIWQWFEGGAAHILDVPNPIWEPGLHLNAEVAPEGTRPFPYWTMAPCTDMAPEVLERHARALYRAVIERACHDDVYRYGLWGGVRSMESTPSCRAHLAVGRRQLW